MNNQFQYKPLTPEAAAAEIEVNVETYMRKLRDKTGKGIKDLADGCLSLEQYAVMVNHFSTNYPKAAMIAHNMDALPNRRTDEISDALETDAHKTDDTQNGRSLKRTDDKTDAAKNGRTQNTAILSELYLKIESLEKELLHKDLEREKALLAQKITLERDLSSVFAQRLASEKTDAQASINTITDGLRTEIGRLKQLVADERTAKRTALEKQASDFESSYDKNLTVLSENVRLKVEAETRKTVTATIRKEVAHEYQSKFEKLQNEHYATVKTLHDELQAGRGDIQRLTADVQLFNQKWEFKIKKIWDSELSVINVVSNALALVGLTLVFGYIGALAAVLMIFFFKNVMKNVKIAKREESARFGMWIAYGIEAVYGFFHYTTFFNLLKSQSDSLLIRDPEWVAMGMTVIISGLSISALIQSRKQAKDDIA